MKLCKLIKLLDRVTALAEATYKTDSLNSRPPFGVRKRI